MIKILSRVCAEFRNARGLMIFRVMPVGREIIVEAPEEIRSDPLFGMLISEGSIEIVRDEKQQKELEKDPYKGADATGKKTARKEAAAKATGMGSDTEVEVLPGNAPEAGSGKAKSNVKPDADEVRV